MSNVKQYTPEEIQAIVSEELRKANLTPNREIGPDEMEGVSGGDAYHAGANLRTHEDIDRAWDLIERVKQNYGTDVATIAAQEMKILPDGNAVNGILHKKTISEIRGYMHRKLDGQESDWFPTN